MALRAAAGLLRDGVAVPAGALDAIHPDLSATLLRVATLPGRLAAIAGLADRADLAIGFKQVTSVRRAAVGGTPWHDPSVDAAHRPAREPRRRVRPRPRRRDCGRRHVRDGPGGGLGGFAGYGYGGPFGGGPGGYGDAGGYWAFRALGAGA